ncbi:MAG: hypothetical protein V1495_07740 [Pseudomonadota bacterium]
MNRQLLSIAWIGIALTSPFLAVAGTVAPKEAGSFQGQTVTVAGRVLYAFQSNRGTMLLFDPNLKKGFFVLIPKPDYAKFSPDVATFYSGKGVQVTGMVEGYQGRPTIVLHDPSKIRVVSEAGLVSVTGIPTISATEASKHSGELVTVQGSVSTARKWRDVCVLTFRSERDRPFSAVIFASSFSKFPKSPDKVYQGKNLAVTGVVVEYKGAPQIVVTDPSQIEFR